MDFIFQIVCELLLKTASFLGLTYHEINIIVYFIIIPAIFIHLIGNILERKRLILWFGLVVGFLLFIIPDFGYFSTWLFNKCVDFLMWFDIIGLNYIEASVIICVILPIMAIGVLLKWDKLSRKS